MATPPDGALVLAYLSHPEGGPHWEMRIVPIAFEGPMGDPVVRASAAGGRAPVAAVPLASEPGPPPRR